VGLYAVFVSIPRPIVLKLATKKISTVERCKPQVLTRVGLRLISAFEAII